MKKLSTLLLTILMSISFSFAQSLIVKDADSVVTYDPNSPLAEAKAKVVNISNDTIFVFAQRTSLDVGENQESYFCWDVCYGPSVDQSLTPLKLEPGDSTSAFSAYLDPKGESYNGMTTMRFYNRDDSGDFVDLTINFESLNNTSIGDGFDALNALSNPYPNPARDQATFNYELPFGVMHANLKVYNLLGREIKRVAIDNTNNKAVITTEGMNSGVYFVYLVTENEEITSRKLIVTK